MSGLSGVSRAIPMLWRMASTRTLIGLEFVRLKTVARIDEIVALGGGGSDWSNIDTVTSDAKECRRFPTFVIDRILAG